MSVLAFFPSPSLPRSYSSDFVRPTNLPVTELTSLHFNSIVESGYCVRAYHSPGPKRGIVPFEAHIRFRHGHLTTLLRWRPSPTDRDLRRQYIDCFPYINPVDDRLRIWDIGQACTVKVSVNASTLQEGGNGSQAGYEGTGMIRGEKERRLVVDSFCADQVKRRWPRMYERIREMGYWKSS